MRAVALALALVLGAGRALADDLAEPWVADAGPPADAAAAPVVLDQPAPPPPPAGLWRRTAGQVCVGVAGAGLVSSAVVFAFRFVDDKKTRDAESRSNILPVLLIGSGVLGATGLVLWLTAPDAPRGVALVPEIAPGTAGLRLEGRF